MENIIKALDALKEAQGKLIENIKRYGQAEFVRKNIVNNTQKITEAQVSQAIRRGYFTEKQIRKMVFIPTFAPAIGTPLHYSPRKDLSVLLPSIPAEDIIDGKLIRHEWLNDNNEEEILLDSSACVCFGRVDIETILAHNPCAKGYIYTPIQKNIEFREFWQECQEVAPYLDCVAVKEIRTKQALAVGCIGEFETDFLGTEKYKVVWY